METPLPNPGVYAPKTWRIRQADRFPTAHCHVCLIRVIATLLVHPDNFGYLRLQVFAIGILFLFLFVGSHKIRQVRFHIFYGGGWRNTPWYIGHQRSYPWLPDLHDHQIQLLPFLPLEASTVYSIFIPFFGDTAQT